MSLGSILLPPRMTPLFWNDEVAVESLIIVIQYWEKLWGVCCVPVSLALGVK